MPEIILCIYYKFNEIMEKYIYSYADPLWFR